MLNKKSIDKNTKIKYISQDVTVKSYYRFLNSKAHKQVIIPRGRTIPHEVNCAICGKRLSTYDAKKHEFKLLYRAKKLIVSTKAQYYICAKNTICEHYLQKKKGSKLVHIVRLLDVI